jgi:SAM-dependent methyltransferase
MAPAELLAWLASLPPGARDAALEDRLGFSAADASAAAPGEHMIGYHASGVASVVRALREVPVSPDDVFVDLGSGLGKVVILAAMLTGATARGIELQAALVERARSCATRLGIGARFAAEDARDARLDDGTVFFLYVPFTGPVLAAVLERLGAVAARRAIVVCALGVDLHAPWLVRRDLDAFWLAIYDSDVPGAEPRRARAASRLPPLADVIAFERPAAPRQFDEAPGAG